MCQNRFQLNKSAGRQLRIISILLFKSQTHLTRKTLCMKLLQVIYFPSTKIIIRSPHQCQGQQK
jgi:hypothetical protein